MSFCFDENRNGRGAGLNTKIQLNKPHGKYIVLKVIEGEQSCKATTRKCSVAKYAISHCSFHIIFLFLSTL